MTQIAITSSRKLRRRFSISTVWQVLSLRRQRRSLVRLDDRALQDIGVTRAEAEAEAARSAWDAPEFWQK